MKLSYMLSCSVSKLLQRIIQIITWYEVSTLCPKKNAHIFIFLITWSNVNPKSQFSTVLSIHTDYLRYLTRKQTVTLYPPHLKNVTPLPCKMHNIFMWLKVCAFLQTLVDLKWASCVWALVALKRTGCDVRQMECQAINVTANVQSDHLLHGYMLPVFFTLSLIHISEPTRPY